MTATIDEDAAESVMFPWLNTPGNWSKRRIKFAVKLINDRVEASEISLPYIGLDNIESWTGRLSTNGLSSADGQATLFRPGDVLFGKLRPYLAKVLLAREPGMCSTEAFVLRPDGRVDPDFLAYFFLNRSFVDVVDGSTYGSKMPRASWEFFGKLPLMLPPLTEQRAIAAFLDQRTANIDALIAKKERLLALLAEKRQALITRAVTKGLDPTAPMKDTGISWLGEIPAHWEVKRLDLLNNSLRPIMYGIVLPGPHFEGGVPIIKGGDIRPERLHRARLSCTYPEIDEKHARSRVKQGDIVYAIRGGVGDVELVPRELEGANLTQDAARISPAENVDTNWLLFVLRSASTFEQAVAGTLGATIRGINIRDLKKVLLPVPPIDERQEIADFLHAKDKIVSIGCSLIRRHLGILHEHRSALITSAVTGKFDVSKCP